MMLFQILADPSSTAGTAVAELSIPLTDPFDDPWFVLFGCPTAGAVGYRLALLRSFCRNVRKAIATDSTLHWQVSSRIAANAVAAEVTRRNCFSRRNPPPYVGGYRDTRGEKE